MSRLHFTLENTATGSRARATRFRTLHNEVLTPTFMPVGTHAAVRGQRREDLLEAGAQVLLANTYHLLLRPGVEIFQKFKGIHGFMNWPRSVLTDSGGFQIFCLPNSRVMKEEGAYFKSYVDNTTICLSPERSIETQKFIGSDIMMVLDQCVPSTVDRPIAKEAMDLTHRWALRSLAARGDSLQSIFGIVQGACYTDLRIESAKVITDMPFDGYAIGGLAVGETKGEREDCTAIVTDCLPRDRPRYLMGVGTTLDLLEAVHRGVDMFDCILPTSMAQQGKAFTSLGRRDLRRGVYRDLDEPLDPTCSCYTCKTYSLAYLYHINRVHESQAWQLIGIHNIHFYMTLMRTMREHILNDTWMPFYLAQREVLDARDSYGPKSNRYAKVDRDKNRLQLGAYEIVSSNGISRIRTKNSLEEWEATADSNAEVMKKFHNHSQMIELLKAPTSALNNENAVEPVVVWHVGLGSAANTMTTIYAAEKILALNCERKLILVSFESDLDSMKLALKFPSKFHHTRHPAPHALIKNGSWTSKCGKIQWILRNKSFAKKDFDSVKPNVVFFEPFISEKQGIVWGTETLRALYQHCKSGPTELFTAEGSDTVRTALLAAGFYVARGANKELASDFTTGLTQKEMLRRPQMTLIDQVWIDTWRKSDPVKPDDWAGDHDSWVTTIEKHPQFQ